MGDSHTFFPVISRLPRGARAGDGTRRIIMPTRRSSGSGAHTAKSAVKTLAELIASLSPEILKGMPVGMIVLHLENPRDPRTFRIVEVNPAAAMLTGSNLEDLRGKSLGDFRRLLATQLPVSCLEALRTQEPRNLGEITYGDERIRQGIYPVPVFTLSAQFPRSCL